MGMAGLPRGQKDPSAMLEDYDVYVRGNLESTGLGLRGGVFFFSEAVRSFRIREQRPLKHQVFLGGGFRAVQLWRAAAR